MIIQYLLTETCYSFQPSASSAAVVVLVLDLDTIRYDTIAEFNMDLKAEYIA